MNSYKIYLLINTFLFIVSQFSIKFSEIEYFKLLLIYQSVVEYIATYIDTLMYLIFSCCLVLIGCPSYMTL